MSAKLHSSTDLSTIIPYDEGALDRENPKEFRSGFPAGFKRARKEAGLSQQQFSDIFISKPGKQRPVGPYTVQSWEQGRHLPEVDTIERLCDFFGCSFDYLFGRTDHRNPDEQMICEYTGLNEDAVASLHSLKGDAQAMEMINYFLSNRIVLKALIQLFESEFWDANCIDQLAEGRAISGFLRPEEKKFCVINVVDSLMPEIEQFRKDHEEDQAFSRQMVFRLIQDFPGSSENIYQRLLNNEKRAHSTQSGMRVFSDEQISIAVEFLLYCGYEERMKRDGFDFQKYLDEGENKNG